MGKMCLVTSQAFKTEAETSVTNMKVLLSAKVKKRPINS
jgi:hypothetical protein